MRLTTRCSQPLAGSNRQFQFHKRCQFFITSPNKTFSVAAVRVDNPDRSPGRIDGRNPAPTPTVFAEIVAGSHEIVRYSGGSSDVPTISTFWKFLRNISR
jgi:hypothetical protein